MFISNPALLIRLLLGHVVADFILQSRAMVKEKGKGTWRSPMLYWHSGVYTAVIFVAASRWGQWFWIIPLFFSTHVLIDGWKASRGSRISAFIVDQLAHLALLIAACFALLGWTPDPWRYFYRQIWNSPRILVVVLGYLIVLWPVGRMMNVLTSPFRRQLGDEKSRGLELAGLWIGCVATLWPTPLRIITAAYAMPQ